MIIFGPLASKQAHDDCHTPFHSCFMSNVCPENDLSPKNRKYAPHSLLVFQQLKITSALFPLLHLVCILSDPQIIAE